MLNLAKNASVFSLYPPRQLLKQRVIATVATGLRVLLANFNYESELYPEFEKVTKKHNLDVEVAASGFTSRMAKAYNKALETLQDQKTEGESSTGSDDDDDEVEKEASSDAENTEQESEENVHNGADYRRLALGKFTQIIFSP
ncbi:unnamed protein product [Gongylonema pulchrum]|uniref:DUF4471 domain-containing protein n=1 Tax=Gongylonema pulchrum TaxID=637853 RepID=A0A183DGM2_9BILA|nr:unnamed protein product [Gongylonema pulchrum]